jgi:16S rRNA (guanine527-N7)-methyltransferase
MISLTVSQQSAFDRYAARLLAENERAGLTSSGTTREAIYRRHFAESLALLEALDARGELPKEARVIDIGSGGGLPGIPFAIARPDLRVTLLEATAKKAAFLRDITGELRLENASVVEARAEDAGREPAHREAYDVAVARAVAPLRVLLELAIPFVRVGGLLAAPKGSAAPRELSEAGAALRELGSEVVEAWRLEVLGAGGPPPTLILVRKNAPTAERYPRRAGIPKKRPL